MGLRFGGIRKMRIMLSWRSVALAFGPVIALLTLAGVFSPADRLLTDINFALGGRKAAEDLVLVEIDGRSLQQLNSWPWSRAYHAALIQRLSDAGAETVAFDIDFSAQSAPAADAAFAAAIQAAKSRVVLATFAQPDMQSGGTYLQSLPLPVLEGERFEIRPDVFELTNLLNGALVAVRDAEDCADRTFGPRSRAGRCGDSLRSAGAGESAGEAAEQRRQVHRKPVFHCGARDAGR